MSKIKFALSIIACLIMASGCNSSFAKKYGAAMKPDEFAIIKNEPLIIPKTFDLPKPESQAAITTKTSDKNLSQGERSLLEKTKDKMLDSDIEKKLAKPNQKPNILKRLF